MNIFPRDQIVVTDKSEYSVEKIYVELGLLGSNWHQNVRESLDKEIHYFTGDSCVLFREQDRGFHVKWISNDEEAKSELKSKIEEILQSSYIKKE